MSGLPFSPGTTMVVVLGASQWPLAPKLPASNAFKQAALAIIDYFVNPKMFGLPDDEDHLLNLFDNEGSPNEINRRLTAWLQKAQLKAVTRDNPIRDLIVYYVGHGGFTPGGEQAYYLAIRSTEVDNEGISSLRMTDLARTIKREARSLRRFLILDCCFAESAYGIFQSGEGDPATAAHAKSLIDFPGSGTALLCSSSARDVSLTPKGEKYTMFSGCLLEVLLKGAPTIQSPLSLEQVGREVAYRINQKYRDLQVRPKVSAPDEGEGDIAGFPIFPNPLAGQPILTSSATEPRNHAAFTYDSKRTPVLDDVASPRSHWPFRAKWAISLVVAAVVLIATTAYVVFYRARKITGAPSAENPVTLQPEMAPAVSLSKCASAPGSYQAVGSLCQFPGGALHFVSGMTISFDGAPEATILHTGTDETAYKYPSHQGTSLNSEEVPFIALPRAFLDTFHVTLGDMCVVTYNGRTAYGIVGDIAPHRNSLAIDGSIALARRVGFEPIANGRLVGGLAGGVGYIVFPGSHRGDLTPIDARAQITESAGLLLDSLVKTAETAATEAPRAVTNSELNLTSESLKKSVRWYAEMPITDPNADDPRNRSQHSLWLDLDPAILSQIVSAKWTIHDSEMRYTALREKSEHLEFPFTAFGCWDLATVTVQLTDARPPVTADFNECKAKRVSTRPGG